MRSVSIDDKLYADIKEYCDVNELRVREYVEGLLKKAFLTDKYGATPFAKEFHEPKEEKKVQEEFADVIEGVSGPDKLNDMVSDLILSKDEKKEEPVEEPTPIKQELVVEQKPQRRVKKLN